MEANNSKHERLKKALQSQLEVHPEYQGLSIENQTLLLDLDWEIFKAKRNSEFSDFKMFQAIRDAEEAKVHAEGAKYQLERAQKELELARQKLIGKV